MIRAIIAIILASLGLLSQAANAGWCVGSAGSQPPTDPTCGGGTYTSQGLAQASVNCIGWTGYTPMGVDWGSNKCIEGANNGYYYTFADTVSCPAGQKKQADGSCASICPANGTSKSSGIYNLGTNVDAPIPRITCDGGCETSYTGEGVTKRAMVNGVYNYYYGSGAYTYTGNTCSSGPTSPSNTSVPPNTCDPATQQTGQVNGVTVCLNKSDTQTTTTTTSPPVTDANGNVTSTQTTNTTDTSTGDTTETRLGTTTSPDGTVTQTGTSTTTKSPPSSFCQANPTDPTCLKNSKFCQDNPETLGCATLGTVTDSVVPTVEKGISEIIPKTVGGAGACPAPVTASFMGRSISFSYDIPCQAAGMLRPLILALAWLAAGLIFIGGVKQ